MSKHLKGPIGERNFDKFFQVHKNDCSCKTMGSRTWMILHLIPHEMEFENIWSHFDFLDGLIPALVYSLSYHALRITLWMPDPSPSKAVLCCDLILFPVGIYKCYLGYSHKHILSNIFVMWITFWVVSQLYLLHSIFYRIIISK